MTQEKNHNQETEFDNYISENCYCCGVELTRTEDIFVTEKSDQYICLDCKEYYKIHTYVCISIN